MDAITFISELVDSLAWPAAIVVVAFIFRAQLRKLIPAIRSFQYKGFRFDFGDRVFEVEERAEEAQVLPKEEEATALGEAADPFDVVAGLANSSPRAAIVEAWRLFENELREGARRVGLEVTATQPSHRLVKELQQQVAFPGGFIEMVNALRILRNDAAHAVDMYLPADDALEYVKVVRRLARVVRNMF